MSTTTWHTLSADEVAASLQTAVDRGLSSEEARVRLRQNGPNQLAAEKGRTLPEALRDQFNDPMVIILLVACLVSLVLGEYLDGGAILAIVILNAVLGVVQEFKADQALAQLKELTAPRCRVRRDGRVQEMDSRELVPGDVVVLEAGDPVPADLRLVDAVMLQVDESLLTGESVPADKDARAKLDSGTPLADQTNMAFMSTAVTYGRGTGVVVATGMQTEIGRIAGQLQEEGQEATPLQQRLSQFSRQLGSAMIWVCVAVGALGLWRGLGWLHVLMVSVSLAVATIPEGLPAVTTVVLALGVRRMATRNAVIRRLSAVETLGSATVICSDKTGTLTQNRMTVTRLWIPDGWVDPEGAGELPADAALLLRCGALCTDATLDRDETGAYQALGDPTETALVMAAVRAGMPKTRLEAQYPRLAEVPFSSDRKRMTTVHRLDGVHYSGIVKGGPDVVLARCTRIRRSGQTLPLTAEWKEKVAAANLTMAREGVRVLAVALSRPEEALPADLSALEQDLELVGLIGMTDPPRPESAPAVARAHQAGIRTLMITGDHRETALAIARSVGIAGESDRALTGPELSRLSDPELDQAVREVSVYARVSPEDKVRIVDALRRQGQVVAMTGDGVNDAPALRRADIGVAMGLAGTGVARGAADMVLMDDNFATIVHAVAEGRTIFGNIQRTAFFLISANLAELLVMTIALVAGMPLPLQPIQLLWINLITDSLPAIALGLEPADPGTMQLPPRDPQEPVLTSKLVKLIAIQAVLMTAAVMAALWTGTRAGSADPSGMGSTYAFATLTLAQLWWAHGCRSLTRSPWQIGLWRNRMAWLATLTGALLLVGVMAVPLLQPLFQVQTVSPAGWGWILLFSLLPALLMEPVKRLAGR